MKKIIRSIRYIVMDPQREVRERIFIIVTLISIPALLFAVIGDLFIGDSPVEIVVLLLTLIIAPLVTWFAIKKNMVQLGATFLAAGVVLVVVPISFCFGGGVCGGSIIWFCFSYMYIGLILVGFTRGVMMTLLTAVIVVEYYIAYIEPSISEGRSRFAFLVDSGVSVIIVGITVYVMVMIEYRLYLDESTRALEQAKKIEDLNRAQNVFFSSMSHEIRTPINTIIGLNEMNLREAQNAEIVENSRNIQSASQILLSVINDILDMSKIASGKMDIIMQPYEVSTMISDIVNMISVKAKEKGLRFRVSVDPAIPAVLLCDEVRLKQILINLLNNAVKYTEKGEVSLQIHCGRVHEGYALVTYTVEDTGVGIKKENIPHLFDAFQRTNEEKNRYIEGTGLGLSIVKRLTELLGGNVSVSSVYNRGSSFHVEIRQEIVDERIIGSGDPERLVDAGGRKAYHQSFEAPEADVLVVDDNSSNLLVMKKLLRDTLVKVDTASGGEECLEMTLKKKYNIIFLDHYMPGMSGIEVFHAIREQAGGLCRNVPVVALTANAGSDYIALYKREGFDEYLVKPLDSKALENMMIRLLPRDIVRITQGQNEDEQYESDRVIRQLSRKVPVLITTDGIADVPEETLKKSGIPLIPFKIAMNGALFSDDGEISSEVILRYQEHASKEIIPFAPHVDDYEEFFSGLLSVAQHIIHISAARNVGNAYANACEAAMDFYSVSVFDSGQLSGGVGIMAVEAKALVDGGVSDTEEILRRLTEKREKLRSSFLLRSPEYFAMQFLSDDLARLVKDFEIYPAIGVRDSTIKTTNIFFGDYEKNRKN